MVVGSRQDLAAHKEPLVKELLAEDCNAQGMLVSRYGRLARQLRIEVSVPA